jgi:hypothetical protein
LAGGIDTHAVAEFFEERGGVVEEDRVDIDGGLGTGGAGAAHAVAHEVQGHFGRAVFVAAHGLPLRAVGVDVIAEVWVVAVLGGHADMERGEVGEVGIVAIAAAAFGTGGGGEEIVVVDAELAGPFDGRVFFLVAELVECPPGD